VPTTATITLGLAAKDNQSFPYLTFTAGDGSALVQLRVTATTEIAGQLYILDTFPSGSETVEIATTNPSIVVEIAPTGAGAIRATMYPTLLPMNAITAAFPLAGATMVMPPLLYTGSSGGAGVEVSAISICY
jgi:hypothetical protein